MRTRTDPATQHLATVAAQAAVLRAKTRELAQLRAELDRMIVNAYRDHVPASHLADAAGFTRDTIHAAVRPWLGKKRPHPTTSGKATAKTTGKTTTKPTKTQATTPKSTTKPASRTRTTTTTKAITKAAKPAETTATRSRRKPTAR